MKWSHDYKRDVLHPNKAQTRTCTCLHEYTLENIKGAVKNEQSSETGNIDEDKQNKNTTQYVLDTLMLKHK